MVTNFCKEDLDDIINLGLKLNPRFKELFRIYDLPENENILVYKTANKILAFLHYLIIDDTIEILNLIVNEKNRNEKIASLLIDYLLSYDKRIILEVRESNLVAINLYHKYNFVIINIREKYYGNESGLVMERV